MNLYKVPDVSVLTKNDQEIIVFSPLVGIVSVVTNGLIAAYKQYTNGKLQLSKEQEILLTRAGLLSETVIEIPSLEILPFKPREVTLFLTSSCNLRCRYCYANAGELEDQDLDITVAQKAIEFIANNAAESGGKSIRLAFHGGGEPTYRWDLFTSCVEYAKRISSALDLELKTSMTSNGIYSDRQIDWLIEHFGHVSLSWDGPPKIQNLNRPLLNGNPSSPLLEHTAQRFIEAGKNFTVRATITSTSVRFLDEIYDYFVQNGIKRFALEPEFECGRCKTTGEVAPSSKIFIDNFAPLLKRAKNDGITVANSMGTIENFRTRYCGAAGINFCVTTDEMISSCYEVTNRSDARADVFLYGRYNRLTKSFECDEDKRRNLFERQIHNLSGCSSCAVKWNCGGDCLAKAALFDDLFNHSTQDRSRCELQLLIAEEKIRLLCDDGGINEL